MSLKVTFLNFYMSALRNMFLTSSIAVGMVGLEISLATQIKC